MQKRVNLVDLAKSCPNFHFSVSLRVPFLNLLFELDSYSNEYLLAKIGVDTAEDEPLKVWRKNINSSFIRLLSSKYFSLLRR